MPNPKLETYKHKATGVIYDLTDKNAQAAISDIQGVIPSGASASDKLVIQSELAAGMADKVDISSIGIANGVAELDSNGKIPSAQLPSYVDDVLEYASQSAFPATGETGKIYVALDTNKTYRWSGTAYVEISESLALGETSSTAYRGDRGKAAYDHALAKGAAFASGLYKITTNSEGHVTGVSAVTKQDITGLGIPGQDTVYDDTGIREDIADINADITTMANVLTDMAGVVAEHSEELNKLNTFSASETILDSSGGEILDSSNNRILDSQVGAAGVAVALSNVLSWFKTNAGHLVQDSGYTVNKATYELINS